MMDDRLNAVLSTSKSWAGLCGIKYSQSLPDTENAGHQVLSEVAEVGKLEQSSKR